MADDLIQYKPNQMAKSTWDYLLKFTLHHEGVVNHMYHNFPLGSKFPDVSCGIGFLLAAEKGNPKTPSPATVKSWRKNFINPDGTTPEDDQFIKEWERCYEIKRVSQPRGNMISEFIEKVKDKVELKLRLRPEIIKPKMAQLLTSKLNDELSHSPLKDVDFWNLPAVAQVAIASVSYGFSPTKMPNFATALKEKNFYRASSEIKLSNMSDIKNYDHWLLMRDADYLYTYHKDDPAAMGYTPLSVSKWILLASQPGSIGSGGKSEQIMSE